MKTLLLLCSFFMFNVTFSQSFCDGWEDGFNAGKESINEGVYIVPICPIAPINGDTYSNGYNKGYAKATGSKVAAIPKSSRGDDFCDGWEKGYKDAMSEMNRGAYIVPICPIAPINGDSFDAGYSKGYKKAYKRNGKKSLGRISVQQDDSQSFCDGWERGFELGLQEWADENDRMTPSKMTPICPIPSINQDTYQHGFDLGRMKAFEEMEM